MEKRIAALAAFDVRGRLGELGSKVLVVVADDDMLVPSLAGEILAEELGDAPVENIVWGRPRL